MKSKKNLSNGFTLIELLVVIAVIGILASVVLASLANARQKGKEAKVQSQMASMRETAELYRSAHGSYTSLCSQSKTDGLFQIVLETAQVIAPEISNVAAGTGDPQQTQGNSRAVCHANSQKWVASVPFRLNSTGSTATAFWCVDSDGASKQEASTDTIHASGATQYQCP
jgi:prepilin-type N-terminal cleavage/methylation domain-containing protein